MSNQKESPRKQPTALDLVEYTRTMYEVTPAAGVEAEHLEDPSYWAHVAYRLRPGDRIEAIPADRHYFAELFVLASARNWAKVVLIRFNELIPDSEPSKEDGYLVDWSGRSKWRIVQGDEVLSQNHDTKELALEWLKEHKKELA
jgi:hypothetical protein